MRIISLLLLSCLHLLKQNNTINLRYMLTNVPVCARAGRAKLGKGLSKGSDCVCACSGASAEAWHKAGQSHREGQVHRGIVHLAIVGRTGATCQRLARGDTGTHNSAHSGDVMYNREARKAELLRNSKCRKRYVVCQMRSRSLPANKHKLEGLHPVDISDTDVHTHTHKSLNYITAVSQADFVHYP